MTSDQVGDPGLGGLSAILRLPDSLKKLKKLDLSGDAFTVAGMDALGSALKYRLEEYKRSPRMASNPLQNLVFLSLASNKIDDAGVRVALLSPIRDFDEVLPKLRYLSLQNNAITDDGFTARYKIGEGGKGVDKDGEATVTVDKDGNRTGAETAKRISSIMFVLAEQKDKLPELRLLDLSDNKATDGQKQLLRKCFEEHPRGKKLRLVLEEHEHPPK